MFLDGVGSAEEDSGLHLRCDVDAFPSNVTFIWYHNDEPLPAEVGANLNFRHAHQVMFIYAKPGSRGKVS